MTVKICFENSPMITYPNVTSTQRDGNWFIFRQEGREVIVNMLNVRYLITEAD